MHVSFAAPENPPTYLGTATLVHTAPANGTTVANLTRRTLSRSISASPHDSADRALPANDGEGVRSAGQNATTCRFGVAIAGVAAPAQRRTPTSRRTARKRRVLPAAFHEADTPGARTRGGVALGMSEIEAGAPVAYRSASARRAARPRIQPAVALSTRLGVIHGTSERIAQVNDSGGVHQYSAIDGGLGSPNAREWVAIDLGQRSRADDRAVPLWRRRTDQSAA